MLIHRNSKGIIRWMEVSDYLKRESKNGKKEVKQIQFEGEEMTVASVHTPARCGAPGVLIPFAAADVKLFGELCAAAGMSFASAAAGSCEAGASGNQAVRPLPCVVPVCCGYPVFVPVPSFRAHARVSAG